MPYIQKPMAMMAALDLLCVERLPGITTGLGDGCRYCNDEIDFRTGTNELKPCCVFERYTERSHGRTNRLLPAENFKRVIVGGRLVLRMIKWLRLAFGHSNSAIIAIIELLFPTRRHPMIIYEVSIHFSWQWLAFVSEFYFKKTFHGRGVSRDVYK